MTEYLLDIWERRPGRATVGWSNVRRGVTLAEAEEYEEAVTERLHIEIHREWSNAQNPSTSTGMPPVPR